MATSNRSNSRKMELTIQVRASAEQKAKLKAKADAFGISVGELCRQTIFSTQPKSKTDLVAIGELASARAELGRVGGLLKGWLSGSFPTDARDASGYIRRLLKDIEEAQSAVVRTVEELRKPS